MLKQIRSGYFSSLGAPIICSAIVTVYITIEQILDGKVVDSLLSILPVFTLFIFFSMLYCAIASAIIGIPSYLILSKFGYPNKYAMSLLGGVTGLVIMAGNNNLQFFVFGVIYGLLSGYMFWRGANAALTSA